VGQPLKQKQNSGVIIINTEEDEEIMSASYAERLSEYPNKGLCGLPENYDTERSLSSKIVRLAQLMSQSSYTVALTGAGISTAAGIPDFRGPNGIWTKEQRRRQTQKKSEKRKRKRGVEESNNSDDDASDAFEQQQQLKNEGQQKTSAITDFFTAKPTLTHRALAHLITRSKSTSSDQQLPHQKCHLQHIITQNIDGLHGKSPYAIPRNQLSILHGDIFTEKCSKCQIEYKRDFEIETIGLQPTGRLCDRRQKAAEGGDHPCNGQLIDTLLDWEDDLPEKDWAASQTECGKAELILCLGTSLRIEPAGRLCLLGTDVGYDNAVTRREIVGGVDDDAKKEKGSKRRQRRRQRNPKPKKLGYVIVNLQETPYDNNATLVIRARVDDVMERLMWKMGYGNDWDKYHKKICKDNYEE
jgi:mono-ADP-ribosyltransferase sirtuin 6